METSRRTFLKGAGLTVLGLSGAPSIVAAARRAKMDVSSKSLQGKRWAFLIDTRKCMQKEGCRYCIEACHSIHNVPEIGTSKEEIKWIWKEPLEHVFPDEIHERSGESLRKRPIVLFCNHCDNPPCVRVCPTQATWQRQDGVVMMDQHRCIGCRYCIVACPYGARSFNWRDPRPYVKHVDRRYPTRMKGVVEKCTLCAERLARGDIPACVEACNNVARVSALIFGDLEDQDSRIYELVHESLVLRRKASLGTRPQFYYLL